MHSEANRKPVQGLGDRCDVLIETPPVTGLLHYGLNWNFQNALKKNWAVGLHTFSAEFKYSR